MKKLEYRIADAFGDTVTEKYETLYRVLYEHNKETPIRFIVSTPEIISIFQVATVGFEPSPIISQMGELEFVGKIVEPGVNTMRFQVFKSNRVAKDELLLFGENGNGTVKFVDWIS